MVRQAAALLKRGEARRGGKINTSYKDDYHGFLARTKSEGGKKKRRPKMLQHRVNFSADRFNETGGTPPTAESGVAGTPSEVMDELRAARKRVQDPKAVSPSRPPISCGPTAREERAEAKRTLGGDPSHILICCPTRWPSTLSPVEPVAKEPGPSPSTHTMFCHAMPHHVYATAYTCEGWKVGRAARANRRWSCSARGHGKARQEGKI